MSRLLVLFSAALMLAGCSQQAKIDRHLKKGDAHFEAGRYEQATIEYLNVLQADRSNAVAIVRSGLAHFELGNAREAVALMREGIKIEPDNLELRLKLGTLYRLARMLPESREQILAILEREPDHFDGLLLLVDTSFEPEDVTDVESRLVEREEMYGDRSAYHMAMAQVHMKKRSPGEVEISLNRALELDPEDIRVLDALAEFHDSRQQPEKAEAYLQKAAELAEPVSRIKVKWEALQYAKGDREGAVERLREMVAEDPNFIPAWSQLGNYALMERRTDESQQAVTAILEVNPSDYGGRLLQARLWLVQGETEKAIEGLESLIRQNPASGMLHHQLGLAYLSTGKIDPAKDALREATTRDRRLVKAFLQLAELNLRTGQAATAARDLEALIGDRGGFPEAVLLLARAYLGSDDPERALASLRGLEEMQPESHVAPFMRGDILLQLKRNREARAAFELAQERSPDLVPIVARLAVLDLREDQSEAATDRVKAAIEKMPDQAGLHHMLGIIYAQTDQPELAEQAFRNEIKVNPKGMQAYLSLTKLLVQQERADEALAKVEEGLEVEPDNLQTLMLSGMFHEELGDIDRALDRYTRIIELEPRYAQAINNAAYLYAEQKNDLDKAFELAKQAREISPNDPAIADTLGWITYRRGEYPWALTLIQEGAESYPDHAEVQYHVAMAQLAMGNEAEALDALSTAMDAEEDPPENIEELRARAALLAVPVGQMTPAHQPLIDAVLASDDQDPSARVRQAALLEQTDAKAARTAYQSVLQGHPQYAPATLRLIDLHDHALGDRQTALQLAREARTSRPDDPELTRRAGWLALREGEAAWAYTMMQESARALPADRTVAYQLAVATHHMGDIAQAKQMLEELVEAAGAESDPPEARPYLALLQAVESPADDMVAKAKAVDAGDPASVPAAMVIARGQALAGDAAGAVATLEAVLDRVPTFAPAAAEAARLYADELGDIDQAHPLASRAREAMPDDAEVARLLGRLTYEREDYAYAIQLLEQGLRANPDHAESLYLLGLSRRQQGDTAGARQALGKALELDPTSPHAAAAGEVLEAAE